MDQWFLKVFSMISEYKTTIYDQKLNIHNKLKQKGLLYKQQLLFPFCLKRLCHMTYKKTNMCNQWHSLLYEVVVVQMTIQQSSDSLLYYLFLLYF